MATVAAAGLVGTSTLAAVGGRGPTTTAALPALQSWLVAYWGAPPVPLPENVPPQANLTLAPSEPLQLALVADSTAAVAVQYAPTQTALPLAVVSPSLQLQALRVDASLHP